MTSTMVFQPYENFEEAKPNFSPKTNRKNTYTLERRPKDATIRRRPPVSPRRIPEFFTPLQETPKQSPRGFPRRARSLEDLMTETNTPTASNFSLQLPTWKSLAVSPKRTLKSESSKHLRQTLSQETMRDSGFDDSNSFYGSQQSLNESTASISSLARCSHKAPLVIINSSNSPVTSNLGSTDDVSSGSTNLHAANCLASSKSMELLTNDDLDTIRDMAMSAADIPSETPQKTAFTSSKPSPIPSPETAPPAIPKRSSAYLQNCTFPDEELLKQGKRISRMLQLTPKKEAREIKPLRTLQAAFSRFGTLLRKGRNSSDSSSSPSPTSGRKGLGFPDSPVLRRQKTHALEFGISSPPKKPAEINSKGVRMSRVEYDQVNIGENQKPSLDCPTGSISPKVARQPTGAGTAPMTHPSSYDEATGVKPLSSSSHISGKSVTMRRRPLKTQQEQNVKPSVSVSDLTKNGEHTGGESQEFSNTVPRPKVQIVPRRRRTIVEEYDIATPMKIPPREHRYLTIIIDTPPTLQSQQESKLASNTYENNSLEMKSSSCLQLDGRDMHVYSTPKPQSMRHANASGTQSATSAGEVVAKYENQNIQNGSNNGINFSSSPLHVYEAAPPSSDVPHRSGSIKKTAYENSEIHLTSSGGIAFGGQDLHVYEIPSEKRPPTPPPPPLPPKPAPQDQASSPQDQQKSETSGCTSKAPPSHVPPKPEADRQTSFSSPLTLREASQNHHGDSHHPDDESHEYYNQNKYSKLSDLKPANLTFTPPPKQITSDSDRVSLTTDTESDIYEPIPDLKDLMDTRSPPPLPPLPLEVPGYSKLSFGSDSTVNTNSKVLLTRNATQIPFCPPMHPPPFIHSQSSPGILSSPALPPQMQSLESQTQPLQKSDINIKPLPLKPVVLDTDSDSDIYDTILSSSDSEDKHVKMQLDAPVRPLLPPKAKKLNFELPKLPAKLKSSTLHSQLPSQSTSAVKCPPKTLPKNGSQIVLSESSKSADGKTYRSWTSQKAIDNPRDELQSKLKRRINIIQAQLEANSASTSATVKKPIPSLPNIQSTVHSSPEVSVQEKRVSPKQPVTEGIKVPLLPPTKSHTMCASDACSNTRNAFPQKCQTMQFKQATLISSLPPHSDKASSAPKAPPPPPLPPSPAPTSPSPPCLPQAEKLLPVNKISSPPLQSTCNAPKSGHKTQGLSHELMEKIHSISKRLDNEHSGTGKATVYENTSSC